MVAMTQILKLYTSLGVTRSSFLPSMVGEGGVRRGGEELLRSPTKEKRLVRKGEDLGPRVLLMYVREREREG
jgi:hypothetical protein